MKTFFAFLVLFALPVTAQQRLAIPAYITCDHNQLTAWMGEIKYLNHQAGTLNLALTTDYQTEESLQLHYPTDAALLAQMRLHGVPFTKNDWHQLYESDGTLRNQLRAVIWLCEDSSTEPVINWQPPK
ncbi:hypothetical protein [Microbulbifer spongiae]|uniref:Uncharacterized protein n=1 Tax=Microbulbifer spongiae TaxID=2944933 RepID=A0ABY9E743_9GAMM|nr:hypothetical protein [Microbulbifer sp. MI-G]WKD48161.1 hypothetical protein M8T91_09370 [Microbulbifer sp. MI-G]